MGDLIGKLSKEGKQQNKQLKIENNPVLEELIGAFYKAINSEGHEKYFEFIFKLKYTAKDIEDFSIMMPIIEHKNFKINAGIYLNMLVNNCKDNEITLYLKDKELDAIGAHNYGKEITIYGNVGYCTGFYMYSGLLTINGNVKIICDMLQGGKIIVNGNTESWTGSKMNNGKIIIEGDAEDYVGERMQNGILIIGGNVKDRLGKEMKNGKIIINGNAGKEIGYFMCGGCIELKGDYKSIDQSCKGTIYHKGKLILDNGNPIDNADIKW